MLSYSPMQVTYIYVLFQGGNYIFEFDTFAERDVCREFVGESQLQIVMLHISIHIHHYILRLSGRIVMGWIYHLMQQPCCFLLFPLIMFHIPLVLVRKEKICFSFCHFG